MFNGISYNGTYCSQEVAIKVLKPERVNSDMQREFAQEVFIMRSVDDAGDARKLLFNIIYVCKSIVFL